MVADDQICPEQTYPINRPQIARSELAGYFGGCIPEVAFDFLRESDKDSDEKRQVLSFMGRAFEAGSHQVRFRMETEAADLKARISLLEKREECRSSDLYRMQWRAAEEGSYKMMIWLGRQELGQTDNPGPVSTTKTLLQTRALRVSDVPVS